MKIVMVCEFFDEELEYQESLLPKFYRARGIDVTVVTSTIRSVFEYVRDHDRGKAESVTYSTADCKIIRLPFRVNILNRIKVFPSLLPILQHEAPDLIFFHDIIPNVIEAAQYVLKNPACKMIMDYHADYSNSGKGWLSLNVLHKIIRKSILRRADPQISKYFPVVPGSEDFLHEVYGISKHRMELLPLGTDLAYGRKVKEEGEGARLRAELGITQDATVVFTGGKLNPLKNTEYLIDAIRSIEDAKLHLLIAGTPEPAMSDYAAVLRVRAAGDPRIHFRGWQDRPGVYRHMAASDVAVFPASQSVLWQQAIGMGLPLILGEYSVGSRHRQSAGYLDRHENVIFLDPHSDRAEQIAHHLKDLIRNPEKRARMSAGASLTASELLDWDRLVDQTLQFNQISGHTP